MTAGMVEIRMLMMMMVVSLTTVVATDDGGCLFTVQRSASHTSRLITVLTTRTSIVLMTPRTQANGCLHPPLPGSR